MEKFRKGLESVVLLIVRLGFAAVMFVHGWTRVTDGSSTYIDTIEHAGLPFPTVIFWATVALEIGGAVLLALGALVRVVGALFVAEFIMTGLWIHWWYGFRVADNGYEYAAILALLSLVFVGFGGGLIAVDHLLFGRKKKDEQEDTTPYPTF
jgi:putative oxidoreductase